MRIAVISDTHDHLPAEMPERLRGADEIWHLGDVCAPVTLAGLEELGVPLQVVRGNCDGSDDWPLSLTLERGGTQFYLVHIPPERAPDGIRVVLHGHTHRPRNECSHGVRWLNPGTLGRPRGEQAGFAWLTLQGSGEFAWQRVILPE